MGKKLKARERERPDDGIERLIKKIDQHNEQTKKRFPRNAIW